MTNEKVRTVLFDFLAFVVKKSATALKPLVLYLFIKLSNLLLLLLLLLPLLPILLIPGVILFIVLVDIQQMPEIITVYRLIYLFSILTNYFYSEKIKVQYSFKSNG